MIEEEAQKHGDILQIDAEDKYENLSYKTLFSFAWLWQKYNNALNWIIKIDDDLQMNIISMLHQLDKTSESSSIHCATVFRNMPNALPDELCKWERMPDFCNGFIYAVKPDIGHKLAAVSILTPHLPLDDLFVTGVLRGRLQSVGLHLMKSFEFGSAWIEWLNDCPFMGVMYHYLAQNLAQQRDQGPWKTVVKMGCNAIKRYFDDHTCG